MYITHGWLYTIKANSLSSIFVMHFVMRLTMPLHGAFRRKMEAALGEAYMKHFGEPVEVQSYKMVRKKWGKKPAE